MKIDIEKLAKDTSTRIEIKIEVQSSMYVKTFKMKPLDYLYSYIKIKHFSTWQ